ncbi:MAG: hypothetical protein WCD42_03735 [Rhizomicrobium sp.]
MSAVMLTTILDWAAKNWRLLLIPLAALLALAAILYGVHLYGQVDALNRQLAAAQAVNTANRKEIATIKENAASSAHAVAVDAAATNARATAISQIKRNIYHATPSQGDCSTVGPQLRAALDGLRQLQAGNAHTD